MRIAHVLTLATAVATAVAFVPDASAGRLRVHGSGTTAGGGTASFTLTVTAPAAGGDITNYAATTPGGDGNPPGTPPGPGCVSSTTVSCDSATTEVQSASLVLTKTGGRRGGGAEVTKLGLEAVRHFRAMQKAADKAIAAPGAKLAKLLR